MITARQAAEFEEALQAAMPDGTEAMISDIMLV